jgi:hypothetical protein
MVDESNMGNLTYVIGSCTRSWGGVLSLIIPCKPGAEPSQEWLKFLELRDPDEIIDTVGVSAEFRSFQYKEMGRRTFDWDPESEPIGAFGATAYSAFRRLKDEGESLLEVTSPYAAGTIAQRYQLPLAYRWGILVKGENQGRSRLRQALEAATHSDFIEIDEIDVATWAETDYLRALLESTDELPESDRRGGWPNRYTSTLLELTLVGVPVQPSFSDIIPVELERKFGSPLEQSIVVVGSWTSVGDLCLAWNIRALRSFQDPFPIWVDPSALENSQVLSWITDANQSYGQRWINPYEPMIVLVSASMSEAELEPYTTLIPRSFVASEEYFEGLLPSSIRLGIERDSISTFRNGMSEVAIPDISKLGHYYFDESIGVTVQIENWKSPQVSPPDFRSSSDLTRISRNGVSGTIRFTSREPYDLATIRVQSPWNTLSLLAKRAGYIVTESDKGRLAIAVLALLEGPGDLEVLACSKVYYLLRAMAQTIPRQAVQSTLSRGLNRLPSDQETSQIVDYLQMTLATEAQWERPYFTFDHIAQKIGSSKDSANWLVEWLLDRHLLFRGYEVKCPNCGLKRWHIVDELASVHLCEGCRASHRLPVPVNVPLIWRYRINEAMAMAIDQGVYPHLLAVRRIVEERSSRFNSLLGTSPGVQFTPIERGEKLDKEVDVVAIMGGELTVVECKSSGDELDLEKDVMRLLDLARILGCKQVVFATPTSFSEQGVSTINAKQPTAGITHEVWESADMLDPYPREFGTQATPEKHLSNVIDWIKSRTA